MLDKDWETIESLLRRLVSYSRKKEDARFSFQAKNADSLIADTIEKIHYVFISARQQGREETIESFERWGRSRMKNYEGSELQGKVEQMKSNLLK